MYQLKATEQHEDATAIIHVDWPMARWSRNVAYRRGDRVLPYRPERHLVVLSGQYPDGDAAA